MTRSLHLILLFALTAGLAGVAVWFQSWGALALLAVGAAGWGWYRVQVLRSAAAETEQFFADAGEETRLTQVSPSEMPLDRTRSRH